MASAHEASVGCGTRAQWEAPCSSTSYLATNEGNLASSGSSSHTNGPLPLYISFMGLVDVDMEEVY